MNQFMIYSIYLFVLITWIVNQLVLEFNDKNFKKVLTLNWWNQKLSCWKCMSFWITLICTQSFIVAGTVSLINYIFEKKLETKDSEIKL